MKATCKKFFEKLIIKIYRNNDKMRLTTHTLNNLVLHLETAIIDLTNLIIFFEIFSSLHRQINIKMMQDNDETIMMMMVIYIS